MRWIKILFLLILIGGIAKFLQLVITYPSGGWDAWAIWNLKAKFILVGSSDIFAPQIAYSHLDYPLLLPAVVAFGWCVTGSISALVPIILTVVFTWGTVAMLFLTTARFQPAFIACLLTIALIVAPDFIGTGANQTADMPMAFFNLGSVVAITLYGKYKKNYWLALAGTLCGIGLNIKNEGALFLVCFALIYSLTTLRQSRAGFIVFGFALLPWVIVLLYFKLAIAPANDVINTSTNLSQLFDFNRHRIILTAFWSHLSVILVLPVSVFAVIRLYQPVKLNPVRPLFLFLLMLAGYYCIYLVTPNDLVWHLESSLNQLLIQILPFGLLGAALSIQPIVNKSPNPAAVGAFQVSADATYVS